MLVRLAVGAGDDDGVAVGVRDPELAVSGAVALALGGVAVRWSDDGRGEPLGALHGRVEVGDVAEPQQDAVADLAVRVADAPVVVLDLAVVELQHQHAVGEQPLVLWAAVVALQAEELLIPAAGGLDVAHREHGLRLSGADRHDDADPVTGRVVDLGQLALAGVQLAPALHHAAAGDHAPERGMQLVGRDPHHRPARGGRGTVGRPLPDHPGGLEAARGAVGRPAEHRPVEGRRAGDVHRGQLQVPDLAVRRVPRGAGVALAHVERLPAIAVGLDAMVSPSSSRSTDLANHCWYCGRVHRRWRVSRSKTAGSIRTHTVSTASSLAHPSRRGALPASWSTIHPAVVARCAVSCPASSSSSTSVEAASNAARTSPADRSWAEPSTPATTARSPWAVSASTAAWAQLRSSTATGSSSPTMATSIAALSSRPLVPNSNSTIGRDTPARAAIVRMVAPANPRSRNTAVAASRTRRRVRRACASRRLDRYARDPRRVSERTRHTIRYG